eukprot:8230407-Pyramimonas_sp.AAC.1
MPDTSRVAQGTLALQSCVLATEMRLPWAETKLSYSQVPPVRRGSRDIASAVARARRVARGAPWMRAE